MEGHLRKRGDKWYFSFELASVGGERKRIERVGGRTKKEAAAKMRQAMAEYDRAGQMVDESDMSVSDYFDYWMANYVEINLRYNSKKQYTSLIENHMKPSLGMYRLSSLTSGKIQEFINTKYEEGYSESTLSVMRTIMTNAFGMAVHPWQFIKINPATNIRIPKVEKDVGVEKDLKIITVEEYKSILNLLRDKVKYTTFLEIGFHTGLRPGEILALQWKDLDLDAGLLNVNSTRIERSGDDWYLGKPKTESSIRTISISEYLVSVLKLHRRQQMENQIFYGPSYRSPEGYNFVCTKEDGSPVTRSTLGAMSRSIRNKLGIDFNAHSLRHTHASMLYERGMEPKLIQERLGHSKLSTTMDTYAHVTEKLKKKERSYLEDLAAESL